MQSDNLDTLYHDVILDHYKSPRYHRLLEAPNMRAEGFNPFCGDRVVLTATVDEGGRIASVGFLGEGCAISQASASMMAELLKDRTLPEAEALVARFRAMMQGSAITEDEEEELGDLPALEGVRMFPVRIKCALLAWSALQDALAEYRAERQKGG